MIARNRRTGTSITGELISLAARASTLDDEFERDETGKITYEYSGDTEIFWSGQRIQTRRGQTIFLDEDGNQVFESEIELVNDLDKPLQPTDEPLAHEARPALDTSGRKSGLNEVVPMYEVVDPTTGAGQGTYTTLEAARANSLPTDLIAYAAYTITDDIGYVEDEDTSTGTEK